MLEPLAGSSAQRFDLVWARVPYSNGKGSKGRPFLVWRDLGWDFWGFPLTKNSPRTGYELDLSDWDVANLPWPCSVRIGWGCPVDKQCIYELIGTLSDRDAEKVAQHFALLFETSEPKLASEEELDLALA